MTTIWTLILCSLGSLAIGFIAGYIFQGFRIIKMIDEFEKEKDAPTVIQIRVRRNDEPVISPIQIKNK